MVERGIRLGAHETERRCLGHSFVVHCGWVRLMVLIRCRELEGWLVGQPRGVIFLYLPYPLLLWGVATMWPWRSGETMTHTNYWYQYYVFQWLYGPPDDKGRRIWLDVHDEVDIAPNGRPWNGRFDHPLAMLRLSRMISRPVILYTSSVWFHHQPRNWSHSQVGQCSVCWRHTWRANLASLNYRGRALPCYKYSWIRGARKASSTALWIGTRARTTMLTGRESVPKQQGYE